MREEVPCSIYEDNGYQSQDDYLQSLSEDYDVPIATVDALADVLGPTEDFDGLVTAL